MIEVRTLGRTSVAVNGVPLTGEAAWPKSLALIVYMAREPGPDRREQILGVLWPDRDEKRARRALNQLLYTLRKASPELDLESVSGAVDFGREVWLDVEELERRLESGDLRGAVDLYHGPFLSDLRVDVAEFDHWADAQRADLQRKFRKAALQLAMEAKGAQDHDAAVAYCRRLLEADPLDDEAQHLLIECLHLRGDRVPALRQFEAYRDLLARELEVEPLDHTLELVERIRGEPAAAGPGEQAEVGDEARDVSEREAPAVPAAGRRSALVELLGSRGLIAVGALLAATVLTVWLWPRGEPGGEAAVAGIEGAIAPVAVLPFELHGFGAEDADLAVGVAQLFTLELGGQDGLPTIDHRAVLRHWEAGRLDRAALLRPRSLQTVARELGAASVLLGDLHASGDEVWVVVELVDAESGALRARADVRGGRDTLFELLDRLASGLAGEVQPAQ